MTDAAPPLQPEPEVAAGGPDDEERVVTTHPTGRGTPVRDSADIAMTAWSAPNPFGESTAFVLVHPVRTRDDGRLTAAIATLGLKRLDAGGDILPIGTGILYASLRALRIELCTTDGVWLSHPVTDDWTGHAIARRYVVLAVGLAPLADDADATSISAYLTDRENVHAALVKIRVRFDRS